jgi:hypothetical protein
MKSNLLADISTFHTYQHLAGQTVYWSPLDSHERWIENMKDPKKQKHLVAHGFDNEHAITYSYNSHGFRCDDFDHEPGFIALGCSITMGIGVPVQESWPSVLSDLTGLKARNLGLGGAGMDTCFRMLFHYIDQLNPKFVAFVMPAQGRFEFYVNNYPELFLPGSIEHVVQKHWYADNKNSETNFLKNYLLIEQLCQIKNIKLVHLLHSDLPVWQSGCGDNFSTARDLKHPGAERHVECAEKFVTLLNQN